MKRGWLGILPALLLLALYMGNAGAQGGDAAQDGATNTAGSEAPAGTAPAAGGGMQISQKFGFSIALPSGGKTLSPESAGWPWPGTPSAAFHWYGAGSPAKEVLVHCYEFQAPVSEATYRMFKSSLLESFTNLDKAKEEAKANDKAAQLKEAMGAKEEKSFVLGDPTNAMRVDTLIEQADGSRWNLLAVKDQRHEAPLGYSILSTYGGNRIYSVTLIYNGELTDEIKGVGGTIMSSLSVPGMTGPFGIEPLEITGEATQAGVPATAKPAAAPAKS